MKLLLIILLQLIIPAVDAQTIFFARNGYIDFYSSTPVEDIKAVNRQVNSVLNIENGEIEFSVLINAFQFEKALMQEHFNEKFMESGKFPKAHFKGKLADNNKINYTADGTYPTKAVGKLTIHGVTNEVELPGELKIEDGRINTIAVFRIAPADYNITIPAVVRDNIAKEVKITVNTQLKPYNK